MITSRSSVSIGEIVIVPQNQSQSSSGIIGVLVQTLEVPQLELSSTITVFPNPTQQRFILKQKPILLMRKFRFLIYRGN